jgi:hypothetical protein
MRRLWDALGAVLVSAIALKLLYDLIKPYAVWLIIGLIVAAVGMRLWHRSRSW